MISAQKRLNKLVHYFEKFKEVEKFFHMGTYESTVKKIMEKYSDLKISEEEVRSFYGGLSKFSHIKEDYKERTEEIFYDAGMKYSK